MSDKELAEVLRLGPDGRLLIPKSLRRAVSLEPGHAVAVWVEGNRLVLQSRAAVEDELWELFRGVDASLADELVAERRAEAAAENALHAVEPRHPGWVAEQAE